MTEAFETALLRRTAAVVAAVAAFLIAAPAAAQTYNCAAGATLSVAPNGAVQMTCGTTPQATTPGLSLAASASTAAPGTNVTFTASAPTSNTSTISNITVAGTNCTPSVQSIASLAPGASTTFTASGATNGTTCSVTISATGASSGTASFSVTNNTTLAMTLTPSTTSTTPGTSITMTAGSNIDASVAVTSTGCMPSTSVVNITAGGTQTFTVTGLTGATSCVVNLVTSTGTQATSTISLTGTGTGTGTGTTSGGTTFAGCPTVASSTQSYTFSAPGYAVPNGNPLPLRSGQIAYMPLPNTAPYANASINMGYTAITPGNPSTYEISISRCPGVIASGANGDPTPAAVGTTPTCYVSSSNSTLVQLPWYQQAIVSPTSYCVVDPTQGPWYVSIRYNYSSCAYGTCGEQVLWNY